MKLKVCGLTKEDHVRYCVQNKVEFCAIRVIFDDLDFSIPLFIHRMIDQNGEIIIKDI